MSDPLIPVSGPWKKLKLPQRRALELMFGRGEDGWRDTEHKDRGSTDIYEDYYYLKPPVAPSIEAVMREILLALGVPKKNIVTLYVPGPNFAETVPVLAIPRLDYYGYVNTLLQQLAGSGETRAMALENLAKAVIPSGLPRIPSRE